MLAQCYACSVLNQGWVLIKPSILHLDLLKGHLPQQKTIDSPSSKFPVEKKVIDSETPKNMSWVPIVDGSIPINSFLNPHFLCIYPYKFPRCPSNSPFLNGSRPPPIPHPGSPNGASQTPMAALAATTLTPASPASRYWTAQAQGKTPAAAPRVMESAWPRFRKLWNNYGHLWYSLEDMTE